MKKETIMNSSGSKFLLIFLIASLFLIAYASAASNIFINGNTYSCGLSDSVDPERYGATDCKTDVNFCVAGANVIINGQGYECGASDGIDPDAYGAICSNDLDSCVSSLPCQDDDMDGYGQEVSSLCQHQGIDCNDNNAAVNPGASDANCNNIDDDCDGTKDDGYVPTTCGVGVCERSSTCVNGQVSCVAGSPTQSPESTCNDNLDNDCDGLADCSDSDCINTQVCQALAECSSSMISYWQGEGNAFDTLGRNNGNFINPKFTNGQIGNSFDLLNRVGWINISNFNFKCSFNEGYSVEGWVKLKSNSMSYWTANNAALFSSDSISTSTSLPLYLYVYYDPSANSATIAARGSFSDPIIVPFSRNEWYHIAAVYSYNTIPNYYNETLKVYVNGQLVRSMKSSVISLSTSCGNTMQSAIGASISGGFSIYDNSSIDEVAIYNKSLSAAEILQHYQNGAVMNKGYCDVPDNDGDGVKIGQGDCDDNNEGDPSGCPINPNQCTLATTKCAICIHPTAKESTANQDSVTCWDTIDNNCDGLIDQNDPDCVTGSAAMPQCDVALDVNGDGQKNILDSLLVQSLCSGSGDGSFTVPCFVDVTTPTGVQHWKITTPGLKPCIDWQFVSQAV